jgi:hypothetical protein
MKKMAEFKTMQQKINYFIKYFTKITKEQADFMEDILKWDDETRAAFMVAKRIFDEKDENE